MIFAQASVMAGELGLEQLELLRLLCRSAQTSLGARLKEGIRPEDCKSEFVLAASLYARAALLGAQEGDSAEEFRAGDLTVKTGGTSRQAAAACLEKQADRIMAPYIRDRFAFLEV